MKNAFKSIISALLAVGILLGPMTLTRSARADTFYQTFMSLCQGQDWLVSIVNSEFLKNGQRFSDQTLEDDPVILGITELVVPAEGITAIPEAVKYFKNLSAVDVSYNQISDLSPLNACGGLTYIKADGNNIASVDTSAFAGLDTLLLSDNLLETMPVLTANSMLTTLDLSNNNIREVTSLAGLEYLTYVDLSNNMLSTAYGLGELIMDAEYGSTHLDLSYNRLTSVEFSKNLKSVTSLDVSHNLISSGLENIADDVVTLDISHNNITSASGFAGKTGLRSLDLSHNLLTTVEDFNTCAKLIALDISANKITDTRGLDGFVDLELLDLSYNGLKGVPLCTTLTKLKQLDLSHNSIVSFALINRYASLEVLDASHNLTDDFSAINAMKNLVYADFSYNSIMSAYNELYKTTPSMRVLKLSGNSFSTAELANVLANGYSEIWLGDMDLSDKLPDMTLYPTVAEIYLRGSTLTDNDVANLFARNDYTGIGLGGIIDDNIVARLGDMDALLTLDLSGTAYMNEYIDIINTFNVPEISLRNCGLTSIPMSVLDGAIKRIDCSANNIEVVPNELLLAAVYKGVRIDFSDNKIMENHGLYPYVEDIGYNFDGNYLDINGDRGISFSDSEIKCSVGETVDLYSRLSIIGIYDKLDIPMVDKDSLANELVSGKASKVTIDEAALTVTVNKRITKMEDLVIKVSVKENRRERFSTTVQIFTENVPVTEDKFEDIEVIYGIELGTTYEALLKSFGVDDDITVQAFAPDGTQCIPEDPVGTGAVIKMTDNDTGEVIFEKTAVIFGDCNGNGKINSTDVLLIKRHIFRQATLSGVYFFAADVYDNNKINSTDILLVKRHIFRQSVISQTR